MSASDIPKAYEAASIEEKWYEHWNENGMFRARVNPDKKPFSIVIPPPNVTGALHIGHAYNNSVQDIYTRFKRMQGYEALWTPGTDHAGITTQTVVEKRLKSEGKDRKALGRDAFVAEVWKHKDDYRARIIGQLQRMGCSCDWEREWFTLDDHLSAAVVDVFIHFFEKGLIYRGRYIVNWCPFSQTAISDEEVDYREVNGKLWHFKYPIKKSDEFLVVATTRPETMLGDTGVAVNPEDERYSGVIGKTVVLPIVGREIPVFADSYVDKEFGSGAVKVTPSHDPNDFQMGKRHNLEFVNIMNPDATLNNNVPAPFRGLDRFVARKKVVEEMGNLGLIEKIEDHVNRVGYSQRGNVPIEPLISEQWFLRMDEMAKAGLDAVRTGRVKFHPEKWVKTYEHWMTNIKDWCISRQLWWGHRIPAYYAPDGSVVVAKTADEALLQLRQKNSKIGMKDLRQDEDVLDTWFSSWLVPFSSMGWPRKTEDLKYFYPTDLLVTGADIIFFWVARMIMAGLEFTGDVPFRQVYFNGIVRDEKGRKMSKSLGNGIDPMEIIEKYSADALRFTLVDLSAEGQDINLSEKQFELGRNFVNKVWNAFRFLAQQQQECPDAKPALPGDIALLADRWILSRYNRAVGGITEGLEQYRLHEAMHSVYQFFWSDFCDWYLEVIKDRLYNGTPEVRSDTLSTALYVFEGIMKLMHPIVPFITEETWQRLDDRESADSIMLQSWPQVDADFVDDEADRRFELIKEIISTVRNVRNAMNVPPSKKSDLVLVTSDPAVQKLLEEEKRLISQLARTENVTVHASVQKPKNAASAVVAGIELFIPLEGIIDLAVEKDRLQKEIGRLENQIDSINRKLGNESFASRAPAQVIEKEKLKLASFEESLDKLKSSFNQLT